MNETRGARRPVRIANCSGFFGDRLSAAREMVEGGPIDVLTGDWLAELTMLILARQRMKHGKGSGYARTFLTQMNDVLAICLDREIKIVTNAGGLDPHGLAGDLKAQAEAVGLTPRIAVVTGDDLSDRITELSELGEEFRNLDTGQTMAEAGVTPLTANAYLGGRGITAALDAGADIVITGRCTDAALVIGPVAWWHGWDYDDRNHLDRLAGALVAGHVIECGAQATGGNYSFFEDIPQMRNIGFPIAEVSTTGVSVITKHPGTGGLVSVGTVTAQLLYEIGPPEYLNPDVTADFSSIRLDQVGHDRVRISDTIGLAPPDRLKVSLNYLGGFRNGITLVVTGLDVEAKVALALDTITGLRLGDLDLPPAELARKSSLDVQELVVDLIRSDHTDPIRLADAQTHLRIIAKDVDPKKVGKALTVPVVESALASYPGLFPTAPPADGTPYGVFWPCDVGAEQVTVSVVVDDELLAGLPAGSSLAIGHEQYSRSLGSGGGLGSAGSPEVGVSGDTVSVPLGLFVGARSGDKGGNANLGLWIPDPTELESVALAAGQVDVMIEPLLSCGADTATVWESEWPLQVDAAMDRLAVRRYLWLLELLSQASDFKRLLPEAESLPVEIYPLPNLRAVNVVIRGFLGRGVSENTSLDPQAKGLGEFLRSRIVEIPVDLLGEHSSNAVSDS